MAVRGRLVNYLGKRKMKKIIIGIIICFLVVLFIGIVSYEVGYFYHRGRIKATYNEKTEKRKMRLEDMFTRQKKFYEQTMGPIKAAQKRQDIKKQWAKEFQEFLLRGEEDAPKEWTSGLAGTLPFWQGLEPEGLIGMEAYKRNIDE